MATKQEALKVLLATYSKLKQLYTQDPELQVDATEEDKALYEKVGAMYEKLNIQSIPSKSAPNYQISKEFKEKYPSISLYLEKYVETDVMNSEIILKAFQAVTKADSELGVANLTEEQIRLAVHYGTGPKLIDRVDPGGMAEGSNANYNPITQEIEFKTNLLNQVETILSGDFPDKLKHMALTAFYTTLLHETAHYGDYLDGLRQDGGEPGFDFETIVWLTDYVRDDFGNPILDSDGAKQINWIFWGDKWGFLLSNNKSTDSYNEETIEAIYNRKINSKNQEEQKTIPSLPKQ